jgi:hypothetical protein
MIKKVAVLGTLVLIGVLLFSIPSSAMGIGIAPPSYEITNAIRGGEYDRSVTVFNPDDNANTFTLRTEGEAGDWITFYELDDRNTPINKIFISPRENFPFVIDIDIPSDAASGIYNATIIAETVPPSLIEGGSGSGVTTKMQATTKITIEVTGEQVLSGEVKSTTIEDSEVGYPVNIHTVFLNTGNVRAKPTIQITIFKDDTIITQLIHDSANVKATNNEKITVKWNTTTLDTVGDYSANVDLWLDGKSISSNNIAFKLFPVGTFSRQGNLTKMIIEGEPAVGSLVKVNAYFKNTGQIETGAKFIGEVYKDGILIDSITSEELQVERNKEAILTSYLKLDSKGKYLIKGKVVYSGKETPVQELSLKVGTSLPGFEGIYLAAILLLFVIRGRKNKRC